MNIFHGKIANLLTSGDEITKFENGSLIRNIIRFDAGNYKCEIKIHPEILKPNFKRGDYKGRIIESGTIDIHGVSTDLEGEDVLTDICWLLSFATMSHVAWYQYDFNGSGKFISVFGGYNSFSPVLEYEDTECIKNFIEGSFCEYQALKDKRKLNLAIKYLLKCDEPNQPLEISFLFASIILESLKSTFAHNKNYKYVGSGFLKKEAESQKCADGSKCIQRYLSFNDLLTEMFDEVDMKQNLNNIKKLRDEVVHNGLSKKSYKDMTPIYEDAQDIIREYILRTLKYKGAFWIYSGGCRRMGRIS